MRVQESFKNMWEMWDLWERVKDMKTLEKYENASETWERGRDENTLKIYSLRKQPTFCDATTGFPTKRRLRNERRNSILMTLHYSDLSSASDWLNQISHTARPIRSTTLIWVVTRHQYGISAPVSQTSFGGETRGSATKCWLFSQAKKYKDASEIWECAEI